MSRFRKAVFGWLTGLAAFFLTAGCGWSAGNGLAGTPTGYAVVAGNEADAFSVKWQAYLFRQLSNRSGQALPLSQRADDRLFTIVLEPTAASDGDYCIQPAQNRLTVRAKDDPTMLWVVYQLLKTIGDHNPKVRTADLPPAVVSFQKETCASFAFEYREPYFAPNLDYDYSGILGTHNVERDWGIWGHGLKKVLTQNPDGDLFALVGGQRDSAQYCASAPALYTQIVAYILNEYGDGSKKETQRFAILPNDNDLVCTCARCQKLGNTATNATPAFTDLLIRLANRFPAHQFFTSAYRTTKQPPAQKLPSNAGVLISTIDLPLYSTPFRKAVVQNFKTTLQQWQAKTSRVYIWDYGSDFDDYFTPFPMLTALQQRLQLFKETGVKGVFLNGSGYEYTSFEDLKTFAAAALMMAPTLSVAQLSADYLTQQYPVTGTLLQAYYLKLEKRAAQQPKPLPLYSGIQGLVETYLDVPDFVSFYETLRGQSAKAGEEEKGKLKKLLAALSFTRLQIARLQGYGPYGFLRRQGYQVRPVPEAITEALALLEAGSARFKDLRQYSETERPTRDYIRAWQATLNTPPDTNLLLGQTPTPLTEPDEDYRNLAFLTDGVRGFGLDYHDGWVLAGKNDMVYQLPNPGGKTLTLSFLEAPEHRIFLPSTLKVTGSDPTNEGRVVSRQTVGTVTTYKLDLSNLKGPHLRLEATRQPKAGKTLLALDELIIK